MPDDSFNDTFAKILRKKLKEESQGELTVGKLRAILTLDAKRFREQLRLAEKRQGLTGMTPSEFREWMKFFGTPKKKTKKRKKRRGG